MRIVSHIMSSTFIGILVLFAQCKSKKDTEETTFTRADSLTEVYLTLQDSLLGTWNMMMKDDNQKIKTMKTLLHELEVCGQFNAEDLSSLGQRIDQLSNIRYTPKTMYNADIVEEYDFASSSLVTELISLAESHTGYSYSKAIQHMVEEIRAADLRVSEYRNEYDAVALAYNKFLENNEEFIAEIDGNSTHKKPLFQMVSE